MNETRATLRVGLAARFPRWFLKVIGLGWRRMRVARLLEVLGPVMIGPSSSHTAGAARLGKLARCLLGEAPVKAVLTLHGSFAATYRGHGTDLALVGGLLGFAPDDERIRDAFRFAKKEGLEVVINAGDLGRVHPNSVKFELKGAGGRELVAVGSSIGGGRVEMVEIWGLPVSIRGEQPTLVATYPDRPGMVAALTAQLASRNINIATMRVTRSGRGKLAVAVIEVDQHVPEDLVNAIAQLPSMKRVVSMDVT
ncbi:MAG: L-serine ammonia-lyase, iron-sulfur-dependent subunit beta [Bacillota bacterium]